LSMLYMCGLTGSKLLGINHERHRGAQVEAHWLNLVKLALFCVAPSWQHWRRLCSHGIDKFLFKVECV